MKKKSLILLTMLLAFSLMLTACTQPGNKGNNQAANNGEQPAEDAGETIKLGGIIAQTGPAAVYGNTTENGIKLAIEEINAAGGINGKNIEYVSYDDKGDPTESVNAYNRLLGDKVVGIIGAITSKPTLAVAEASVADGIPIITPTGTQEDITVDKPNVFRACFIDPYQGVLLANYAADKLEAKTAAVFVNNSNDYSKGIAESFKTEAAKKGIEIVIEEGYADTDNDFRAQLIKIKDANPDVLLIPDYYDKIAGITVQARETGITSKFIGGDGWDGVLKTLDPSSYGDVEDAYFTNHYSVMDESEKVQKFVKDYNEKYGEDPSAFSALGYDATYIMAKAIEEAGSTDSAAIVEKLKGIEIEGITGKLTFDENNNPIKAGTIIKITDGKYTFDSVVQPN